MTAATQPAEPLAVLQRRLILIGEAKSAITQCCLALGDARTNQILRHLGDAQTETFDRIDVETVKDENQRLRDQVRYLELVIKEDIDHLTAEETAEIDRLSKEFT